jgi:uncharacterized damage-inducible protein DinB
MRVQLVIVAIAIAAVPAITTAQTQPASPISQSIRTSWDGAKKNMKESADLMPEVDYAFKPAGTAADVRTFGKIVAHVAGANYVFCSAAKGEKSPFAEDAFEKSATTKAAIVKALGDSLTYCDAVFVGLTDMKAGETIDMPFDMGKAPRASALLGNIGHLNEHYGNLVTYFRAKGMVPPSSRR